MAETILTQEEQEEVLKALRAEGPLDASVLDFFCKNWATMKRVLEFLAGKLPAKYADWIKRVIWIGDKAHDMFCPRG